LLIHKAKSFYCFHKQIIKEPVNYNSFNNYNPLEEEAIVTAPFETVTKGILEAFANYYMNLTLTRKAGFSIILLQACRV
tara:strand:+ start:3069 stop:3305 length:237 start_codon:yes stop_codon:yes gene_type:complete